MSGTARPTPPATDSPGLVRLALTLRELRGRTGLSLAALAARTTYSKSSWERYLNARALPPRSAVRALCRLAGEPEGRCLTLREIAESEWAGHASGTPAGAGTRVPAPRAGPGPARPAAPAQPESPTSPTGRSPAAPPIRPSPASPLSPGSPLSPPVADRPAGHRGVAVLAVLASLCAVVSCAVVIALLLLPRAGKGASAPSSQAATGPLCRGEGCEGKSPMRQHCASSPDTLASRHLSTGAWMELRHSTVCGTSWARMWGTDVGDRLEMTAGAEGRPAREARVRDRADADTYVYTLMTVSGRGTVVRACYRPVGGGPRECAEGRVR
ncbi:MULTISPECIES: helix-turn-helix domain-containing protein [Streptomyces]|uniref:helix-turn-helix domain-containing protein n=1 Tax=Streptomyces TaxID=1883 RepID=UPI0029B58D57|nr:MULTISPECIES: helix-turn-helix domain-containing protein [unclassified Streptomyces]MDX3088537.1 DUF2690 domain-containing protein [Streptomyces sp. ME12-02E]MDX3331934.1 DUF2690 domain-containing protein [Streptomyces sp. ME02-6978a]